MSITASIEQENLFSEADRLSINTKYLLQMCAGDNCPQASWQDRRKRAILAGADIISEH